MLWCELYNVDNCAKGQPFYIWFLPLLCVEPLSFLYGLILYIYIILISSYSQHIFAMSKLLLKYLQPINHNIQQIWSRGNII